MHIKYSRRTAVIVPVSGGAQLDVLRICRFMLQVLTANGARITSYHPILQRLAIFSAQERDTSR
jgi:hypothetical protein